jgi:hypothetical protein
MAQNQAEGRDRVLGRKLGDCHGGQRIEELAILQPAPALDTALGEDEVNFCSIQP